jgi:hypothetical protein
LKLRAARLDELDGADANDTSRGGRRTTNQGSRWSWRLASASATRCRRPRKMNPCGKAGSHDLAAAVPAIRGYLGAARGRTARTLPRYTSMSTHPTLESIVDPKHLSAIADALRTVLRSARAYLDDTSNGEADGLRNTLYREWECSRSKLRRCMVAGGVFKLHHQLLPTAEGQKAHDALRRLARNVGEHQQAPSVAGALPPLPTEASTARLAVVLTLLEEFLRAPPQGALGRGQQLGDEPHPDGPEGGRWIWWKNKRYNVPIGNVYRLIEYIWNRDSARYDDLIGPVFDDPVEPQTIRSYANKVKKALPTGFPWRLSTNSVSRQLTKVPAAKGA